MKTITHYLLGISLLCLFSFTLIWLPMDSIDELGESYIKTIHLDDDKAIIGMDFSADSKYLAVGQGKKTSIYSMDTQRSFISIEEDDKKEVLAAVKFSPNGHYLVNAYERKVGIYFYDDEAWNRMPYFYSASIETSAPILSVAFSTDSKQLVIGTKTYSASRRQRKDGVQELSIWDVETGKLKQTMSCLAVSSIAIHGSQLFTGHQNGSISIWKRKDEKYVLSGKLQLEEEPSSPDNADKLGKLASVRALQAFGNYVVAGSQSGKVGVWQRNTAGNFIGQVIMDNLLSEEEGTEGKNAPVAGLYISESLDYIYVSFIQKGLVKVIDIEQLNFSNASSQETQPIKSETVSYNQITSSVIGATFSPDGRYMALASSTEGIHIIDPNVAALAYDIGRSDYEKLDTLCRINFAKELLQTIGDKECLPEWQELLEQQKYERVSLDIRSINRGNNNELIFTVFPKGWSQHGFGVNKAAYGEVDEQKFRVVMNSKEEVDQLMTYKKLKPILPIPASGLIRWKTSIYGRKGKIQNLVISDPVTVTNSWKDKHYEKDLDINAGLKTPTTKSGSLTVKSVKFKNVEGVRTIYGKERVEIEITIRNEGELADYINSLSITTLQPDLLLHFAGEDPTKKTITNIGEVKIGEEKKIYVDAFAVSNKSKVPKETQLFISTDAISKRRKYTYTEMISVEPNRHIEIARRNTVVEVVNMSEKPVNKIKIGERYFIKVPFINIGSRSTSSKFLYSIYSKKSSNNNLEPIIKIPGGKTDFRTKRSYGEIKTPIDRNERGYAKFEFKVDEHDVQDTTKSLTQQMILELSDKEFKYDTSFVFDIDVNKELKQQILIPSDQEIYRPLNVGRSNPNAIALIIDNGSKANGRSDKYPEIKYAKETIALIHEYAKLTLGIPKSNFFLVSDRPSANKITGALRQLNERAQTITSPDVFVFYTGFIVPNNRHEPYFLTFSNSPVEVGDMKLEDVKDENFLSLKKLIEEIQMKKCNSLTVVLDVSVQGFRYPTSAGSRVEINHDLVSSKRIRLPILKNASIEPTIICSVKRGDQFAWMNKEVKMSAFSYSFLQTLKELLKNSTSASIKADRFIERFEVKIEQEIDNKTNQELLYRYGRDNLIYVYNDDE